MEEAQAAANKRTAAIGISDSKIVVLAADDAEEPIESTTDVLAITDTHRLLLLQGCSIIRMDLCLLDRVVVVEVQLRVARKL